MTANKRVDVGLVARGEVAHQLDHLVEQAGLAVVMAVVEQVGCDVPEL